MPCAASSNNEARRRCSAVKLTLVTSMDSSAMRRIESFASRRSAEWNSALSYSTSSRAAGQYKSQRSDERPVAATFFGSGISAFIVGCGKP